MAGMAEFNRTRRHDNLPVLRFGIGLHIGDVIYGNIGALSRLDFTITGPAVNLVNRIEHLSRQVGRPILTSAEFAARLPGRMESLGKHELPGLSEPHEVYALSVLSVLPRAPTAPAPDKPMTEAG
jgi:adenylate cyclase